MIDGLSEHLHCLIDVTIAYPHGVPTFWDFLCGRCPEVLVNIGHHDIPQPVLDGVAREDREALVGWVADLWHAKDHRLNVLLAPRPGT